MKKLGLVLCGLTPFLFGGLMNWVMMTFSGTVLPFKLIGFVFFADLVHLLASFWDKK